MLTVLCVPFIKIINSIFEKKTKKEFLDHSYTITKFELLNIFKYQQGGKCAGIGPGFPP